MKLWVGTSGYSYKEWKGSFYPQDLPDKEMLRYYGERLPAVEINNTFYRLPKVSVLESWAEQVPDDFHFALKASQKITHKKRLGVLLFQLPPYLRKDLPRLERFLDLVPEKSHVAFEFRHDSWFDDDVFKLLQARGCALCIADTDNESETLLVATARWGYLRLRRPDYDEADLTEWMKRIQSQNWEQTYVFFKHEDEGAGPKLARRFLELAKQA